MLGPGTRTKKVTSYGKKKTHVVTVHDDFTATYSPSRLESVGRIQSTSDVITASPIAARRPALVTKYSNDVVNAPPPLEPFALSEDFGKSAKCVRKVVAKVDKPRTVVRPGKAKPRSLSPANKEDVPVPLERQAETKGAQATPTTTRQLAQKTRPARQRQMLDSVEVSLRQPTRDLRSSTIDLSEPLSELTLKGFVSSDKVEDRGTTHSVAITALVKSQEEKAITVDDLLAVSSSSTLHNFYTFLASSDLSAYFPHQNRDSNTLSISKVGEASYSEVFACGPNDGRRVMIKVVPLLNRDAVVEGDFPEVSEVGDVVREIEITRRMSQVPGGGFVEYLGSYLVEGKYPSQLVDEWWKFKRSQGSASVTPEKFTDSQQYALVLLSDGGTDLESFKFDPATGWIQAAGLFWQIADSLARAEQWTNFEHRDLHEGQILLSPHPVSSTSTIGTSPSVLLSPATSGIRATIIDFGLSRLNLPDSVSATWTPFPQEVFEGKGEQWDVYRSIRDAFKADWEAFHPISNVMWLHYLARYLLHRTKSLKKPHPAPIARPSRRTGKVLTAPVSEADERLRRAYEHLRAVEDVLARNLDLCGGQRSKRGTAKALEKEEITIGTAGDVMAWGRGSGWV